MNNAYIDALERYTEADWLSAIGSLLPAIHEVDRNAVQIWFRFYPLDLVRYLEGSEDVEQAMKGIVMEGEFGLLDKIDTSHHFLYGHRYWPQVKAAVIKRAGLVDGFADLAAEIRTIAREVAVTAKTTEALTIAISAVGLMTLDQAGLDELKAANAGPSEFSSRTAEQIIADRKKDASQGLFGFLRTVDKTFDVSFESHVSAGSFRVIKDEEIASASQKDHSRDWQALDSRCWEGPVPIECTSASCGTCWVGVLAGEEKLSEVSPRERRQMKVFGYNQPDGPKPFIRLACQSKAEGNVTLVIPPWNAVFGRKVRGNVEDRELEPVTTSAKQLRESLAAVGKGE